MSFYVSGSVLGGFMGRFLLGHLHELIGWRAGYYVMAAMTLIGALWGRQNAAIVTAVCGQSEFSFRDADAR